MSDILISPAGFQEAVATGHWLVFDVRHDLADHQAGRRAYEQGHLPGALYLDHELQLSAPRTGRNGRHPLPNPADFAALMRQAGLRPETRVLAYDASGGMFAAHLWWMLRWIGHEHVAVLDGGWQAWLAAGGAVETEQTTGASVRSGLAPAQAESSVAVAQGMPTVDADAVLANLSAPEFVVVDARAAERFRGQTEPMDPVAGHIPGALNRPHSLNLQADGRFKTPAQLRDEFNALLAGRSPSQIVHQCGSGITASHNVFAMELAGLKGSALYPGSWSEWCSDPARPVARGE